MLLWPVDAFYMLVGLEVIENLHFALFKHLNIDFRALYME